jgi:hypothetical protein
MEKNLLAAIMGAVGAYIQQEEASRTDSRVGISTWRLLGQRQQVRARTNAKRIRPQPRGGVWRYYNLGESMTSRTRWIVEKAVQ